MQLLIRHQGIFTINELPPNEFNLNGPPRSLYVLLAGGALSRINTANFRASSSTPVLAARQKKALALRLARCLMEFFDTGYTSKTWDLQNIFASFKPGGLLSRMEWYAAFSEGERRPGFPEFTTDKPDPSLLSFAHILLAIEEGNAAESEGHVQEVHHDLRLSRLFLRLHVAEQAGCGLYAEAIRGCLFSHVYVQSELSSETPEDVDVMAALRKVIREKIVLPLEAALDPPRRGQKRRREDYHPVGVLSGRDVLRERNARAFETNGRRLANVSLLGPPVLCIIRNWSGYLLRVLGVFSPRTSNRRIRLA